MYFAKNCILSKILRLLLRSDYVERKELCLVSILENTFFLLNNILLGYIIMYLTIFIFKIFKYKVKNTFTINTKLTTKNLQQRKIIQKIKYYIVA
jgi:hypothetical protein